MCCKNVFKLTKTELRTEFILRFWVKRGLCVWKQYSLFFSEKVFAYKSILIFAHKSIFS